tara:strand:- start:2293 stop:4302 length:2010 start_codon:yes stop_codon:yes gene_type:complete
MSNTKLPARLLDTSAVPALNVTGDLTVDTTTLKVDSTNNRVGIGAVSPASKLHIKNTASEDTAIILENTNNAQNLNIDYYSNAGSVQSRINYAEGPASWNFIPNTSNGNSALYINYSGNIGIGETSPSAKLHIKKAAATTQHYDSYATLIVEDPESRIQIVATDGGSNASALLLTNEEKHWGVVHHGPSENNTFGIGYYASSSSGVDIADSLSSPFTITTGGFVGIGTDNPSASLTIDGDSGTQGSVRIVPDTSKGNQVSHIHYGGTGDWYIRSAGTSGNVVIQDSGGNVGIGTATPGTAKLNVTAGSSANTTIKFGSHFDTKVQIQATATASGMLQFLNASGTSKISLGYRDDGTGGDGQFRIRHAGTLDTAGPMINMATNGAVSVVTDTSAAPVGNSHAQLTVKTTTNANPAYAVLAFDSGVGRLGVIEGQQRAGGSAGYGHISTIVNNGQSGSGAMVRAITANYTGKVGVGKGHSITPDMNLEVYAYNETSQWTSSGSYHGGTQAFGILSNSPPAPVAGDYGYFKDFWYYMVGNTSHTMVWDNADSYFNAEVMLVAACTNGGAHNNIFCRGFWSNNHTSHRFDGIEGFRTASSTSSFETTQNSAGAGGIGGLTNGDYFTFTASQGTNASNSGKLTIVHSYPGASFYGAKIRLRVFFGQFNGHSSTS